jgi:hypothetical protein
LTLGRHDGRIKGEDISLHVSAQLCKGSGK